MESVNEYKRCIARHSRVCGPSGRRSSRAGGSGGLDDQKVVYASADGVYVKAGLEKKKAALLVVARICIKQGPCVT